MLRQHLRILPPGDLRHAATPNPSQKGTLTSGNDVDCSTMNARQPNYAQQMRARRKHAAAVLVVAIQTPGGEQRNLLFGRRTSTKILFLAEAPQNGAVPGEVAAAPVVLDAV